MIPNDRSGIDEREKRLDRRLGVPVQRVANHAIGAVIEPERFEIGIIGFPSEELKRGFVIAGSIGAQPGPQCLLGAPAEGGARQGQYRAKKQQSWHSAALFSR